MENYEKTLFQTYFALIWWSESIRSNFFQSEFFKEMNFHDAFVKKNLESPGVAQGALLLPSLYVALVFPKEAIFSAHRHDFEKIDRDFNERIVVIENTYPGDVVSITRHLRNAVSHSRAYIDGEFLAFTDTDNRNDYKLNAKISHQDTGLLISELQRIIIAHVELVKARINESAS